MIVSVDSDCTGFFSTRFSRQPCGLEASLLCVVCLRIMEFTYFKDASRLRTSVNAAVDYGNRELTYNSKSTGAYGEEYI